MTQLSDYEAQVAGDLLHDPTYRIWTQAEIDRHINEARRQLARDAACLRVLQKGYFTAGVEAYTYGQITGYTLTNGGAGYAAGPFNVAVSGGGGSGAAATATAVGGAVNAVTFSSYGSGYTSPPTLDFSAGGGANAAASVSVLSALTYDVLGVSIFWGAQRYGLRWMPFQQFSALTRPWALGSYQRLPIRWSTYGDTQLYIAFVPDQAYPYEVDTLTIPADLAGATADPIPLALQDPIKFYAAHLAKFNQQAYGEATMFDQQYTNCLSRLGIARVSVRTPDPYSYP